jgi:hypothetical protein
MVDLGWISSCFDSIYDLFGISDFSKQQRIFEAAGYDLTRPIYNVAKSEFNLAEKIEKDFTLVTEKEWNYPALALDNNPINDVNDVMLFPSYEYEETVPKPLNDQDEEKKDSYLKMIKEMAVKFGIPEFNIAEEWKYSDEPEKYYWIPVNKDKLAA